MRLCEARIPCNVIGRYESHKFVEHAMKIGEADHTERYYTWAQSHRSVIVRQITEDDDLWRPVIPPKAGESFRFDVDIQLRGRYIPKDHRLVRLSSRTNYVDLMKWLERCARNTLAIEIDNIDLEIIHVPIHRVAKIGTRRIEQPFIKQAGRFQGDATMGDPTKFLQALAAGIGNAKAYGFGFFMFKTK